jgi:predicted metalloendopeptidase
MALGQTKCLKHIEALFSLSGMARADAQKIAKQVFGFETKLAAISSSLVDRNDPVKTYNKVIPID